MNLKENITNLYSYFPQTQIFNNNNLIKEKKKINSNNFITNTNFKASISSIFLKGNNKIKKYQLKKNLSLKIPNLKSNTTINNSVKTHKEYNSKINCTLNQGNEKSILLFNINKYKNKLKQSKSFFDKELKKYINTFRARPKSENKALQLVKKTLTKSNKSYRIKRQILKIGEGKNSISISNS